MDKKNTKVKKIDKYRKYPQWDNNYIQLDKNGNVFPKMCINNLRKVLDYYNISIKFNILTKRLEITNVDEIVNIETDCLDVFTQQIKDLTTFFKFSGTKSDIVSILQSIAYENKFNPVKDYFNSLNNRLSEKHKDFIETKKFFNLLDFKYSENKDFYFILFKKWLKQFVASHLDINFNPQMALILLGSQGWGKSSFCKKLVPKHLQEKYFHDKQLDLCNKDSLSEATTKMLVEIGELGDCFKDVNKIKLFMTQNKDEYRTPYDKFSNIHKRHTIFIGTINDEQFLRDESGSRRFPVFEIKREREVKQINFKKLNNINIDIVWSEVIYNYFNVDKTYHIEGAEIEKLNKMNMKYKLCSYEKNLIETTFDLDSDSMTDKYWLKSSDIWSILGKQKSVSKNRITRELRSLNVMSKEYRRNTYFALSKPAGIDFINWNYQKVYVTNNSKNVNNRNVDDVFNLYNRLSTSDKKEFVYRLDEALGKKEEDKTKESKIFTSDNFINLFYENKINFVYLLLDDSKYIDVFETWKELKEKHKNKDIDFIEKYYDLEYQGKNVFEILEELTQIKKDTQTCEN